MSSNRSLLAKVVPPPTSTPLTFPLAISSFNSASVRAPQMVKGGASIFTIYGNLTEVEFKEMIAKGKFKGVDIGSGTTFTSRLQSEDNMIINVYTWSSDMATEVGML